MHKACFGEYQLQKIHIIPGCLESCFKKRVFVFDSLYKLIRFTSEFSQNTLANSIKYSS